MKNLKDIFLYRLDLLNRELMSWKLDLRIFVRL